MKFSTLLQLKIIILISQSSYFGCGVESSYFDYGMDPYESAAADEVTYWLAPPASPWNPPSSKPQSPDYDWKDESSSGPQFLVYRLQSTPEENSLDQAHVYHLPATDFPFVNYPWLHTFGAYSKVDQTPPFPSSLYLAVQKIIKSEQVTFASAYQVAEALFTEVCQRNLALLTRIFWPRFTNDATTNIENEQKNLIEWLDFQLQHSSLTTTNNIFEYIMAKMLKFTEKKETRWTLNPKPSETSRKPIEVTPFDGMLSKGAISILGNYYKSENLDKWNLLFPDDLSFIKLFMKMKRLEENNSASADIKKFRIFAAANFSSWRSSYQQPDVNYSIRNFLRSLSMTRTQCQPTRFEERDI